MDMTQYIKTEFDRSAATLKATAERNAERISQAGELLLHCLRAGGKVIIFGNGGSASQANHFAAELVGRFRRERRSLPALALNSDSALVTAIGNDYGFEHIYSRQVEALVKPGDLVIGITTSGKSPNVLNGLLTAKQCKADTLMLTGEIDPSDAKILEFNNFPETESIILPVPSSDTARIQEAHLVIIHLLCELVEREFHTGDSEKPER